MSFLEPEIEMLKFHYHLIINSSEYSDEQISNFVDYVIPSIALHNANKSLNDHWPKLASLNANYDKYLCAFPTCGHIIPNKQQFVRHLKSTHKTQLPDGCRFLLPNGNEVDQIDIGNDDRVIKRFYTLHETQDAVFKRNPRAMWERQMENERVEFIHDRDQVMRLDRVLEEHKKRPSEKSHGNKKRFYGFHVVRRDSLFGIPDETEHVNFIYDEYTIKRFDEIRLAGRKL
jgi:hypothetical protein